MINFFKFQKKSITINTQTINFPNRIIDYFLKPNYYSYIDKTLFIPKLIESNSNELIFRPNSFGKTFNLDILRYFLSSNKLIDERVDEGMRLDFFKKTQIFQNNSEFFNRNFSKFPVIYINFKELDQTTYKDNIEKFRFLLNLQFEQILQFSDPEHKLKVSSLTSNDLKNIEDFFNHYKQLNDMSLINSTKDLSKLLLKITKNNPYVLIDDYDFPLISAFKKGFYDEMSGFMENFINSLLKNNNFNSQCIITGVNKVEIDKLFSQVNNLNISSLSYDNNNDKFAPFFGITEEELRINFKNELSLTNNEEIISKNIGGIKLRNGDKQQEIFPFYHLTNILKLQGQLDKNSIKKQFNIGLMSNYFDIRKLVELFISNLNLSYLEAMRTISLLNNEIEYLNTNIKSEDENKLEITNKELKLTNTHFNSEDFLNFLFYNGFINSEGKVTNQLNALILQESLPNLKTNENIRKDLFDFQMKLAYAYYTYFYPMNKVDLFFEYITNLFSQQSKSKNDSNVNLSFRSEKDLEEYFIDLLTLELNRPGSTDKINILAVEDDDLTKLPENLKKFSLIIFEKQRCAVFLRTHKHKKSSRTKKSTEDPHIEMAIKSSTNQHINELLNNPEINEFKKFTDSKQGFVPFQPRSGPNTALDNELRTINEKFLESINKQEAINYLLKINSDIQKVLFISLSNYQKKIEYLIDIVKILQE
jgi:hypothetical protein